MCIMNILYCKVLMRKVLGGFQQAEFFFYESMIFVCWMCSLRFVFIVDISPRGLTGWHYSFDGLMEPMIYVLSMSSPELSSGGAIHTTGCGADDLCAIDVIPRAFVG